MAAAASNNRALDGLREAEDLEEDGFSTEQREMIADMH